MKLQFALESLQGGVNMTKLCEDYGISKPTGYKWKTRFLKDGFQGLRDASKRPKINPQALSEVVVCELIKLKHHHMAWGPNKIKNLYHRRHGCSPCTSSVKRVLERAGLVKKRRKRKSKECGRIFNSVVAEACNDVWTVDFKGWWHTKDGSRCEPLTVRDEESRFVLDVRIIGPANTANVRNCFERLFKEYGLPSCIRSDNGAPFACAYTPIGLSSLSAWWLALGINLERGRPGQPQDNGAHERMHKDIKHELQRHAKGDLQQQQAAFDVWKHTFNTVRPHESLQMKTPAEVYTKSTKKWTGTPADVEYEDKGSRKICSRGSIHIDGQKIFISSALRGWSVGLLPTEDEKYDVYFTNLLIGEIDMSTLSFLAPASGGKEASQQKQSA